MASRFVYVTYIRATPESIWDALRKPEFTRRYFFGATQESDWKVGSAWKMFAANGNPTDSGEVLEYDPPRRFVLKWRNEFVPELKAEGYTRCAFDLVPQNGVTKLTVTHEIDMDNSKTIAGVSGGWPKILAGLKTLLETGKPMDSDQAASKRAAEAAN
ncbi:MAG TPA: SRPBCC family protein [Bauldia sp.]|nr:SRPBCC family protein [Bauldia sp.]